MKKWLKRTASVILAEVITAGACIGGTPGVTARAAGDIPNIEIGKKYSPPESCRKHINFNREWKFESQRVTDDNPPDFGGALSPEFDDSEWTEVGLPHSFSIPYNMESSFFVGYGLYRKTFDVPEEWLAEKRHVSIEFEGSFIETEVFVNGQDAGTHLGGYTGFEFDITDFIREGKNTIAVRVNNKWRPNQAPRVGEHQFSGGIYRDVYLNVTSPLHVAWYGTFVTTPALNNPGFDEKKSDGSLLWDYENIDEASYPSAEEIRENIEKKQSDVSVSTEIKNETGEDMSVILRHVVTDCTDGSAVAYFDSEKSNIPSGQTVNIPAKSDMIQNIKLWDIEHPNLYSVETVVYNADTLEVLDTYESPLGFRWVQFLTDGLYLNGERTYLFGAGFHQDRAGWGDAGTNAALRRDVKMVKDVGMNFIRGVTYPRDPALVEACDEYGVLFWSENTFWGMGGHLNAPKDTKEITYTSADWRATAYPDDPKDYEEFDASCMRDLEETIRTLRNHPSVFLWSMGNEVFFETDEQVPLCKELVKKLRNRAHELDPTRKAALGGTQRCNFDSLEICDVAGYNGDGGRFNYNGDWKSGSGMGQWGMTMKMPCMASEYGSYTSSRGDSSDTYSPHFHEISDGGEGYITTDANRSGVALWCAYHHGTIGGSGLAQMGFVDYSRLPLKTWYWYRNKYTDVPPEFSQEGTGTRLEITASQTEIRNDATDDAQIIVTVTDDEGNWINASPDVDLEIVSGPGVFPTGKTFSLKSGDTMRDGKGSIDFHSWYAGTTVIRAYADGLESDEITITTTKAADESHEEPANFLETITEGDSFEKLPDAGTIGLGSFIANRPTDASSGKTSAALATDGNPETAWKAEKNGSGEYWQVFTEFSALVYKIRVEFPNGDILPYKIETAVNADGPWTERVSYDFESVKMRPYEDDLGGVYTSYIRVSFPDLTDGQTAEVSDVYVYAIPASEGPTDGATDATYAPDCVYLSDMNADKLTQGWEGQKPQLDLSIEGKPLTVGGVVYKKGLGLHADSEAVYNIDKKYTRFQAIAGIDSERDGHPADAIYQVFVTVDGKEKMIYEKTILSNMVEKIDLSVRGAEKLRLVTDSHGTNSNDHTDWADAKLIGAQREAGTGALSIKAASHTKGMRAGEDFEVNLTFQNSGARRECTAFLAIFDGNGILETFAEKAVGIGMKGTVNETLVLNVPTALDANSEARLYFFDSESGESLGKTLHYALETSSGGSAPEKSPITARLSSSIASALEKTANEGGGANLLKAIKRGLDVYASSDEKQKENASEAIDMLLREIEVTADNKLISVSNAPEGSALIVAAFKDGILKKAETYMVENGKAAVKLADDFERDFKIKAFLWEKTSVTPLALPLEMEKL